MHILRVGTATTISPQMAAGATAVFSDKASRMSASVNGGVSRIAFGAIDATAMTAVVDHLLVDTRAMPAP